MNIRNRLRLVPALLLVAAVLGCGHDYELAPVSGSVTFDGQPLAHGKIQFFPGEGRTASGTIVDGRIEDVSTFEQDDGALVGSHRVAVYAFEREPVGMEIVPWAIPRRYGDPNTSGLVAELPADGELQFDLRSQ